QAIVEKRHVKLAGLEHPRNFLVVVGGHGILARLRMTPGTRQVRAVLGLQETNHHHLTRHRVLHHRRISLLSGEGRPAADPAPAPNGEEASSADSGSPSSVARPLSRASELNFCQL